MARSRQIQRVHSAVAVQAIATPAVVHPPASQTPEDTRAANQQLLQFIQNRQVPEALAWIEKHTYSPAVLDQPDIEGKSPLTVALNLTSPEMDPISLALLNHGADARANSLAWTRALKKLVKTGNLALLKQLVDHGLDLRSVHVANASLFSYAAKKSQMEILRFLTESLKTRVDTVADHLNQPDAHGRCAIHFATHFDHLEMVEFLRENGASLNLQLKELWTPLHLAADAGHLRVMTYLIQSGADLTLTTQRGVSVLHLSALKGHQDTAECAIRAGLNLNLKDNNGNSPLHFAAHQGKTDLVKLLAKHGAELNLENRYGSTPFQEAEKQGHEEITHFLLTQVADRYYVPLIEGAAASHQLRTLKANVLADLKQEQQIDPHSHRTTYLLGIKHKLSARAIALSYLEADFAIAELRRNSPSPTHLSEEDRDCGLCGETVPASNAQRPSHGPARCACHMCFDCSRHYIEHLSKNEDLPKLNRCPLCNDPTQVSFVVLHSSLDPEVLVRATDRIIDGLNHLDSDYRPCPGLDCPAGGKLSEGRYICLYCDFEGCLRCGKDHSDLPCDMSPIPHRREMRMFLQEARKPGAINRPCPNCGKVIHRIDGCNGMMCTECNQSFHWNYGDHRNYPYYEEHKNDAGEVHDFEAGPMAYYSSVRANPEDDENSEEANEILDRIHY